MKTFCLILLSILLFDVSSFIECQTRRKPPISSPTSVSQSIRCKQKIEHAFTYTVIKFSDWNDKQLGGTSDEVGRIQNVKSKISTCRGLFAAHEYTKTHWYPDYIVCFHGISSGVPCSLSYLLKPLEITTWITLNMDIASESECC